MGTKLFQALRRPRLLAIATRRTSMVLLVPRVVGAEIVKASPTLTPSFSAWFSNSRIVPGWARSSRRPLAISRTVENLGSVLMSMPVTPSWVEPVSEMTFAHPRPRWTANSISGTVFFTTSSTFW
jgi:hypothetical protein